MDLTAGGHLEGLLSPVTPDSLFRDHWGKRSLYIPGDARKSGPLGVSLASFHTAITPSIERGRPSIKAQYMSEDGDHRELRIPAGDPCLTRDLLTFGMTLCVPDFDLLHPPLAELAIAVAARFGAPGALDVSCYVSGPGKGFGLHFDSVPVMILQCEGRKRWLYGDAPALQSPGGNLVATNDSNIASFARAFPGVRLDVPREADLREQVLRPGDVLFLPAGTWHRTYAEGVSVGLTFTLAPRRLDALLMSAIARCVEERMPWEPRFDGAPADAARWARARLTELKAFMTALDADEIIELAAAPFGLMRDRGPALPGRADDEPFDESTAFRVAPRASIAVYTRADPDGGRVITLCVADEAIQAPIKCAPFFDALLGKEEFIAGEAVSWLQAPADGGWDDARELLRSLLEIGAIAKAPPADRGTDASGGR